MLKFFLIFIVLFINIAYTNNYMKPPADIVKIVDIPSTPVIRPHLYSGISVHIYYNALPSIIDLAKPMLRLAGQRITPDNFSEYKTSFYTDFKFFNSYDQKKIKITGMPKNIKAASYSWSYTGKYFAFTVEKPKTMELWIVDLNKKIAKKITNNINSTLTDGYMWIPNNEDKIIVQYASNVNRKPPKKDISTIAPIIQETGDKASKVRTYQDMLKNKYDELLFKHYFSSILAIVDINTGKKDFLTKSGIYYPDDISPNGNYLLFDKYKEPFSYTVGWYYFTRDYKIIDLKTQKETIIASHSVSDTIPPYGVYTGPRYPRWQPYKPSTILYVEALDNGDPEKKVPYRDKIMKLEPPFKKAIEILKLKYRYRKLSFLQNKPDFALVKEYNWKKRWNTTHLIDISKKDPYIRIIEDVSSKDVYNTIGDPVSFTDNKGNYTLICKNNKIFCSNKGATKNGYFPFLQTIDINTLKKDVVYKCPAKHYNRFLRFVDNKFNKIHIYCQSPTLYPNYYEYNIKTNKQKQITFNTDPASNLSKVKKELIKYKRKDGIELSGTLYYPIGFKKGDKVPCYLHAYPIEYNDAKTAGQVRGSQYTYTKIRYDSYLFFLMQNTAVFMNAQFPIVGDPKTMNDKFIIQLKMNAEAAVKALKNTGDIDISKLACIGHSYGAFMVANLLIHTDLFKTGIAQSGAYNRTLTPFGFQSERRSFWEAKDTYIKVSPFSNVEKLNEPILLIHGEIDDNPGTYPIQSDRFFAAIKGNGGTAKYVKLPFEKHSYSARESILQVLYERYNWTEKYLK